MNADTATETWSLEVVRGRDPGRLYTLRPGEVVLGSAPGPVGAIDLSDQEGGGPRRMAGRQALLDSTQGRWTIRDLESPGGTFVNRQRVLPGQARALEAGDLIQLGGVQLKVTRSGDRNAAPTTSSPSTPPTAAWPLSLPGGRSCRNWDEVLVVSSQAWGLLRDELTSGRLAAFCSRAGCPQLAPSPIVPGSPDERLDAWLGSLPTTRTHRPELDVHPERLVVRLPGGGGTTRGSIRIANVGARLLKVRPRIDPPGVTWLAIESTAPTGEIPVIDAFDLRLELSAPEGQGLPLQAALVLDSNGGTRRIEVTLDRAVSREPFTTLNSTTAREHGAIFSLRALVAQQPVKARLWTWPLTLGMARLLMVAGDRVVTPSGPTPPGLEGTALVGVCLGALAGALLALRRGVPLELPQCSFAAGLAGVLMSAIAVALCRSIEPALGPLASNPLVVVGLWGGIGLGLAFLSGRLLPQVPLDRRPDPS